MADAKIKGKTETGHRNPNEQINADLFGGYSVGLKAKSWASPSSHASSNSVVTGAYAT